VLPIVCLIIFGQRSFAQTPEKLIKEAQTFFYAENYIEATPKYLQLLSLEPRNSTYNYRYGACLLFNSEKKPDALKYLKFAVTDPDVDPEAHYFLARAYHVNYYFDKAIRSYLTYKSLVKDKTSIKLDLERQIEMCRNGQSLLSKISDIIVKERSTATFADFFRVYNLKDIGGSIVITELFQSKIDRKKNHRAIVHIDDEKNVIFYSSYGDIDENQKDVYYRLKNEKGIWSDPVKLPNTVNTSFDEDFPYLDPNGKFLYFSSKGHNSMGGYDIFRVPIDMDEMKFGSIENLDFAISSADDDVFYVVDKEYKHAYFASSRQSEGGKIHVYRVLVNKFENTMILLAGDFISTANPQGKNITVQIKESSTGKIIDQVKSNPINGAISFSLPRAGKYEFIVQTEKTKTPQVIPYIAPQFEDSRLVKLNFLEEASGNGVSLKVNQDDYYQYKEEEKSDVLANLFLAKSELQPNVQLLDLLEQTSEVNASSETTEILKRLNLDKYTPEDLLTISNQDLNRLKENFKKSEEQKKVFMQLASDNIEKAQQVESSMDRLFDKATDVGLSEKEIIELKSLDKSRSQFLSSAIIANRFATSLQQNSNYVQGDIAKADAVNIKMQELNNKQDVTLLNNLSDSEKTFVKEHFNKIKDSEVSKLLGLQDSENRLEQIGVKLDDLKAVNEELIENEKELNDLKTKLPEAKKKEKPEIQKRIDELEVKLEELQRQERFFSRQHDKLLVERDSIKAIQAVYSQSRSLNPSSISASNNQRLIEAKLKAENAKKINQKTTNVLETVKILETPKDSMALSSSSSSNTNASNKVEQDIKMYQEEIQTTLSQLQNLDANYELIPTNEFGKLLALQQEKLNKIQKQLLAITNLSKLTNQPDSMKNELESYQTQLAVTENIITELNEKILLSSSTETSKDVEIKQLTEQIASNKREIQSLQTRIKKADTSDYSGTVILERALLNLQNNQIGSIQSLMLIDSSNQVLKSDYEKLNTEKIDTEIKIKNLELKSNLAASNGGTNKSENANLVVNSESSNLKLEQDIYNLRSSNQLDTVLLALDYNNSENVLRVQRYATGLQSMLQDSIWNSSQNQTIQAELTNANQWLEQVAAAKANKLNSENLQVPLDTLAVNRSVILANSVRVITENNEQASVLVSEIKSLKFENDSLLSVLESTDSPKQEKRIVRRINKNEKKITNNQIVLMVVEENDYVQVTEKILETLTPELKNDPRFKSEFFILSQKLDEVQDAIEALRVAGPSNQERVMVQVMNLREDFIQQMNQLNTQIAEQNEVDRAVSSTRIEASLLSDSKKLDYALVHVIEEIAATETKIESLQNNLSSYAKSEQPRIENDIADLKVHLEEMNEIRRETQSRLQQRQKETPKNTTSLSLSNGAFDDQLLAQLTEDNLTLIIQDPEFISLRNDLVTFRLLEMRMLNNASKENSAKNEMRALVNKIVAEPDDAIKNELRQRLDKIALDYLTTTNEASTSDSELRRLKGKIESNQMYTSNPMLFNTLAKSSKIQERLVALTSSNVTPNAPAVQSPGITFIEIETNTAGSQNFSLNPISVPGMIYKIQIGAFNRPIDISQFAEFNPITTDQVGNSIRYSAGLFYNKNQAFTSLNPIKALGYKDAFVVAYCDGVRYAVAEADELLRQGKCALNNAAEMAFESKAQVPKSSTYNLAPNAAPALAVEDAKGLLFTVQVGVYNTPRSSALMQNLEPLNTQLTERNQLRYSVGRFDNVQDAIVQRDQVKVKGFPDAFVVAYFNGSRVSISEAQAILNDQGDMALYNKQNKPLSKLSELVAITPLVDLRDSVQSLNKDEVTFRFVSSKLYTKAPQSLIEEQRKSNLWVFYDENLGRLVSSETSQKPVDAIEGYEIQSTFKGFKLKDTTSITIESLEGYKTDEMYYDLVMSWDKYLPAMIAFELNENFSFAVSAWNPTERYVKFAPLNYTQKEKIRKVLGTYGFVSFTENVITF
jgi:hypothetical protein